MGGCDFWADHRGEEDASKAFHAAVEEAQYEYGHGGYTGTIAEMHEFVVVTPPANVDARLLAQFIHESDYKLISRKPEGLSATEQVFYDSLPDGFKPKLRHLAEVHSDKWGPCLAIKIAPKWWAFFGWASS